MRLIDKILLPLIGDSRLRLRLTQRFERDLQGFLESGEWIKFKPINNPDVSVVIPVFNSAHHTLRCLQSLTEERKSSLEVIVFNNASTDATNTLLQRCQNVVVINSSKNLGYVGAVNAAAKRARGRFVLLLNNDATILSGSIGDATEIFDSEANVGAVGARIRLAAGRVQEAGSIIFRDGTTDGYLRNCMTENSSGMYMRDVDFCSGVFLILERNRFASMGGLDETFAPGYYEETDLCMRLRARGLRTVYNPSILIEHFEFGSKSSASAFAAISERHPRFLARWQATLNDEGYCDRSVPAGTASRRLIPRPRLLLVLDYCLPAKLPSSMQLAIGSAIAKKWQVSLFILGLQDISWPEFYALHGTKVELVLNKRSADLSKLIQERKDYYDLIAATGVQSTTKLEKIRGKMPEHFAGVECISGLDANGLEQVLERLPAGDTVQDRKFCSA